jgi:hypothetical protein
METVADWMMFAGWSMLTVCMSVWAGKIVSDN